MIWNATSCVAGEAPVFSFVSLMTNAPHCGCHTADFLIIKRCSDRNLLRASNGSPSR